MIKKFQNILISLVIITVMVLGPSNTIFAENKYASKPSDPSFQIDFIDVGQGDASLVQCDGHYMLIDGGNSKKSDLIYAYLKKNSITYLDIIVGTHADSDHIGGLAGALNYADVGTAYCSVTEDDTKAFKSFVKYLEKRGKEITVPVAGDEFDLGSAHITVLGPTKEGSNDNNDSIVLRIEYGSVSFLFTGDAEDEEEKAIIKSKRALQSTVLKVAHHGSKSATNEKFLKTVTPKYAVISVGKSNTYGHPTDEVLERLSDAGVTTYRTDMQGSIICTSDGKTVSFTTEKNADADTLFVNKTGTTLTLVDEKSDDTPVTRGTPNADNEPTV